MKNYKDYARILKFLLFGVLKTFIYYIRFKIDNSKVPDGQLEFFSKTLAEINENKT